MYPIQTEIVRLQDWECRFGSGCWLIFPFTILLICPLLHADTVLDAQIAASETEDVRAAGRAGVCLAVGPGGHRMLSADAKNWEKHQEWSKPSHNNDGLNVAVFYKGMSMVGGGFSMARVVVSRDGETWSDGKLPGGSPIFCFDVLDGVLYATCIVGQVFSTTNGEEWELVGKNPERKNGQGVRWTASGQGVIVGVGDFGHVLIIREKGNKVENHFIAGQENKTANRVAYENGTSSSAARRESSRAPRMASNGSTANQ